MEERLAEVRARIAQAADRVGRDPAAVEILPVTKGHPVEAIGLVADLGLGRIGENRVAEAEQKRSELGGSAGVNWHLIGHLQRNKARPALAIFDVIESVDSLRLAERLSRLVEETQLAEIEILVQVNASGEAAKSGLGVAEAPGVIEAICELPGLRVVGLMTMAPFTSDEEVLRRTFRETRCLLERCGEEVARFVPQVLSMGMTNDYELAVQEGSTRVRLGTALIGERPA